MSDASSNLDHEGRTIDFGRRAADYDRHRPGFPESFFDQLMDRGWLAPGQRVLDLGAGTGTLALGLAARGADVTGLDIAPELLEVARRRAADLGLSARFVEGAAESTGQADDSFDLVTAGQCWWWFDSDASIAEVTRVLGDGGRLVIGNFSYLPLGANVAARTEDLILTHNPGWPKAGSRGVHPEQVQALDRGGFVGVESFSYTVEVPFTHDSWRGRMRTCNGVGSALTDLEVEHFDHDLASMLMEEFGQHLLVPHRIFVTGGTLPRR
jgi:SAM-dependent methyltransferase